MNIKDLQKETYAIAVEKGWHSEQRTIGDLIALCHSELSEALEWYRDAKGEKTWITTIFKDTEKGNKPEGFPVELADLIMRVTDMAEFFGIDLEAAIRVKMEYNRTRPYRHGGKAL